MPKLTNDHEKRHSSSRVLRQIEGQKLMPLSSKLRPNGLTQIEYNKQLHQHKQPPTITMRPLGRPYQTPMPGPTPCPSNITSTQAAAFSRLKQYNQIIQQIDFEAIQENGVGGGVGGMARPNNKFKASCLGDGNRTFHRITRQDYDQLRLIRDTLYAQERFAKCAKAKLQGKPSQTKLLSKVGATSMLSSAVASCGTSRQETAPNESNCTGLMGDKSPLGENNAKSAQGKTNEQVDADCVRDALHQVQKNKLKQMQYKKLKFGSKMVNVQTRPARDSINSLESGDETEPEAYLFKTQLSLTPDVVIKPNYGNLLKNELQPRDSRDFRSKSSGPQDAITLEQMALCSIREDLAECYQLDEHRRNLFDQLDLQTQQYPDKYYKNGYDSFEERITVDNQCGQEGDYRVEQDSARPDLDQHIDSTEFFCPRVTLLNAVVQEKDFTSPYLRVAGQTANGSTLGDCSHRQFLQKDQHKAMARKEINRAQPCDYCDMNEFQSQAIDDEFDGVVTATKILDHEGPQLASAYDEAPFDTMRKTSSYVLPPEHTLPKGPSHKDYIQKQLKSTWKRY